jgi:hypothetical protein
MATQRDQNTRDWMPRMELSKLKELTAVEDAKSCCTELNNLPAICRCRKVDQSLESDIRSRPTEMLGECDYLFIFNQVNL